MSRNRNRPVAHFWSRVAFSVVLCDALCCAFRKLTQRTQRKATEDTEGLPEAV